MENLTTAIEAGAGGGIGAAVLGARRVPHRVGEIPGAVAGANQRFELALNLRDGALPVLEPGRLNTVQRVDLLARSTKDPIPASLDVFDKVNDQPAAAKKDTLAKDPALGDLLIGELSNIAVPTNPVGELKLFFDDKTMEDPWIAITWSGEATTRGCGNLSGDSNVCKVRCCNWHAY